MTEQSINIDTFVEDSSSVLLLTPLPSEATDEACFDLLTHCDPEAANVLSVTTSESPEDRLARWRHSVGDELPTRSTIVDTRFPTTKSSRTATSDVPSSVSVQQLSDDFDLMDVGMATTQQLGEWEPTEERSFVCIHSVTTLFDSFNRERVVTLIDALNRSVESMDVISHHHVDPTEHSEEILATLRPLYEVVIEHDSDYGWTVTEADQSEDAPSFRSSATPPGGVATTDPDRPETVPIPYSFDTVLGLISVSRRRTILYHLKERSNGAFTLDELVDRVMERETSIPVRSSPDSREEVKTSIGHTHVPKLADVGIVDYDADSQVIEYAGNPALESCIKYIETLELG